METFYLENEHLRVKIHQKGAELAGIQSKVSDLEYMWEADARYWGRHSCILFPIVGKVYGDTYQIDQQAYPLTQHGFARDQPFELYAQTETSISLALESNASTLAIYPFPFRLVATYQLAENRLSITYQVENTATKTLYFSIGAHPAFKCPLFPGEKRSDYSLLFNKKENPLRHIIENGFFTGKTEAVALPNQQLCITDHLFEADALVFKQLQSDQVSLVNAAGKKVFTFDFSGFPYLGIWSKNEASPFVCIEPWFGLADKVGGNKDFREKEGVLSLEKKTSFQCTHSVIFHLL